jgi:hypothetical protein
MPITLIPNEYASGGRATKPGVENFKTANFKYSYPGRLGKKLKPGHEFHDKLRDEIWARASRSKSRMSARYDSWNKIDEQLTSYIPMSEYDKDFKGDSLQLTDRNKPISIVVPVSFAVMETLLTYLVGAFLDNPIFKYDGVGPEDELGTMLMEHVVNVQARKGKAGLALHTMFRDALAYGVSYAAPVWERKTGFRRIAQGDQGLFGKLASGMRSREEFVRFEGTVIHNIDPYQALPDVSVSAHDLQRGEYFGFVRRENRMEILQRELHDSQFFNGQYIQFLNSGVSSFGNDQSARDRDGTGPKHGINTAEKNDVDVIYMHINLVPAEWGLGRNNYPEWWFFALAGDEVIISAQPLEFDHGLMPVVSYAPDFDGYSATPISRLESIYGLQHLVNFLYNSHVANVRKAINDMLVVDPEMINLNDLKNPAPGKYIRLRKRAWGRGVQNAVEQLRITDITAGHISEGGFLQQLIQQFTGATDQLQGASRRTSERVSATEFRDTRLAALSRLEKSARVASMQCMQDLGEMFATNTQQFMEADMWVSIVGRHQEDIRRVLADEGMPIEPTDQRVGITPEDLFVAYDVLVSDGSLPTKGDPGTWNQLLQTAQNNPEIMAEISTVKIFKHIARLAGVTNIEDFNRRQPLQPQVVSDEEAARQSEAGNLVPLGV